LLRELRSNFNSSFRPTTIPKPTAATAPGLKILALLFQLTAQLLHGVTRYMKR
jgi:hypothetical protein